MTAFTESTANYASPALEDTESKIEALRQMLVDGEESGTAMYSYKEFISELDGDS